MKTRLIAFDLDNTLARPNRQISRENADLLKKIAKQDVQIVILSGKPSSYLLGLGRQLGILNIILSGENGTDIYFGNSLPPTNYIEHDVSVQAILELEGIKRELNDLGYDYFYQPNKFSLTPFFKLNDKDAKKALFDYARYMKHKVENIDIYIHGDCVDFTPSTINKGNSLQAIINYLNSDLSKDNKIQHEEIIVVGDSSNDEPMFKLNYRNKFIRSSFEDIKGDKYKYVNKLLEEILEGILNESN